MASMVGNELKRPLPLLLLILAVVGWILVIWLWYAGARTERDLTAELQDERSAAQEIDAELSQLTATVATQEELNTAVASLAEERDQLTAERDAVQAELEQARGELDSATQELEAARAELEATRAELDPLNQQLATFDQRRAEAEQAVVERTQELADVGQRLEEARTQEAELNETLAQLTEDAAQTTQEAADAEERLQAARDAEAQLETELAAAREAFEQIADQQAGLEAQVQTLTEHRDALIAETEAAGQQREAVQAQVSQLTDTLATRADDLSALEGRITGLQSETAEITSAAAAGLIPGRYLMGPVVAVFAADGSFEMANAEQGTSATGRYQVEDGRLTLNEVEGDTGAATFPIICAISPEATGFSLHDQDGSCTLFSGQLFQRVG
jgi:uncharacterized coiled-coil DUF342 family protein